MGIIKLLESRQELDAVTSTQGLVIIDVFSEPYCRHLSSTYSRLPKKFTHLQFYRIDERIFSGFRQFAKQSNISSIPTILVYCNGQNLVKTAVSSPTLVEMLVEHCDEEYLKSLAMIRHPSCSLSALQASIQLNFLFWTHVLDYWLSIYIEEPGAKNEDRLVYIV